jgi:hypothetical protein
MKSAAGDHADIKIGESNGDQAHPRKQHVAFI